MRILHIDHVQLAMPEGREDDARAFYQGHARHPRADQAAAPRISRRLLVRAAEL